MALILILSFVAGCLFAFALASVSQFKLSLEAWKEKRLRTAERGHLKELVNIRELVALGKFSEAVPKLSQMLKEDPDNAVCRALLATCQDSMGDSSAALVTLEDGRGRSITSAELYLKAARIYEKQNNLTAALDNLALLLKTHPNSKKVLSEGVRIAEHIGDMQRAIGFQERLLRLVGSSEIENAQEKLAGLELSQIRKQPLAIQSEELARLLKRHRTFAPAFELQAELDKQRGETEQAHRSLLRGYELSSDPSFLALMVSLWMDKEDPEKAVRNVRVALRNKSTPEGRAYFICLLASVGMLDEARMEFDALDEKDSESSLLKLAKIIIAERSGTGGEELSSQLKNTIINSLPEKIKQSLIRLGELKVSSKEQLKQKTQPAPQFSTP